MATIGISRQRPSARIRPWPRGRRSSTGNGSRTTRGPTGGTASAAVRLVEGLSGEVAGLGFVMELAELKGRSKLEGYDIVSLLTL